VIKFFKNTKELASAFCNELLKLSQTKEKFTIALSGGSTPKLIFQLLADDYKTKINWNKIHLFWGDERCVSPDNEDSNFGMTKKNLLDFLNIPEENVYRIKGEADPELEAKRYSEEIKKYVDSKNGLPSFDLFMLGLGEDGHTASIFPDQIYILESKNICEVAVHPLTGQKRITLTDKVINNSSEVIFLVTGENKALMLKKILIEKNKIYPAEFIAPKDGILVFYVDSDAAKLLNNDESIELDK
jgi:6-phosphogluconolactonase